MADTKSVIGTQNKKGQTFTDPWKMMHEAPRTPSFFTGSEVIKEAIRRASCDVMIAYPITPQSEAAALIGEKVPARWYFEVLYYALAGVLGSTRVLEALSENWKDGRLRRVRPLVDDHELAAHHQLQEANHAQRRAIWREIDQRHAQAAAHWAQRRESWSVAVAGLAQGTPQCYANRPRFCPTP